MTHKIEHHLYARHLERGHKEGYIMFITRVRIDKPVQKQTKSRVSIQ
jgi:hypothetical protein